MFDRIAEKIDSNRDEIRDFIARHLSQEFIPFYSSFDLRASSCKAAAVDANLFPAGFNNICPGGMRAAAQIVEQILLKRYSNNLKTIAIYSEDHTRNSYYFQNLHALQKLLSEAGFKVLLTTTNDYFKDNPASLKTAQGDTIELHQLKKEDQFLSAAGVKLDLLISNNDLSAGVPAILRDTRTKITPLLSAGWWNRTKYDHFKHQKQLFEELGAILDCDPWFFYPKTHYIPDVDFSSKTGFEAIAESIEAITSNTRKKLAKVGADEPVCAFVKSAHGTYGMGVYSFKNGEEFLNINRSRRDSMARGKSGQQTSAVIVQECIRTADRVGELVAEPVFYCLEHRPIGGFLRTNTKQSDMENLNSRGMKFTSEDLCPMFIHDADKNKGTNLTQSRIETYKLIATTATLACAKELEEL